jgi:hypothetical protein
MWLTGPGWLKLGTEGDNRQHREPRHALDRGVPESPEASSARCSGPVSASSTWFISTVWMEREIFRATMSTVVLLGGAARIAGYARLGFYEASHT